MATYGLSTYIYIEREREHQTLRKPFIRSIFFTSFFLRLELENKHMIMTAFMETTFGDMLFKVGVFFLVQVLICLILSKSSDVFSKTKKPRSLSFKPARSVSIRRILAALSDMPPGGEPSPSSQGARTPSPRVGPSSYETDYTRALHG